jgi:hypothetical protein
LPADRLSPPLTFRRTVGAVGLVERVAFDHGLVGQGEVEDLRVLNAFLFPT